MQAEKYCCEELAKILRKRKIIATRSWMPVPRSNEGEPFYTWLKTSKPALRITSGQ